MKLHSPPTAPPRAHPQRAPDALPGALPPNLEIYPTFMKNGAVRSLFRKNGHAWPAPHPHPPRNPGCASPDARAAASPRHLASPPSPAAALRLAPPDLLLSRLTYPPPCSLTRPSSR